MHRLLRLVPLLALWPLVGTSPASAETRVFPRCPVSNGCYVEFVGHIDVMGTPRLPWVGMVAVPANKCIVVDLLDHFATVRLTVIAPDGTVFPHHTVNARGMEQSPTRAGWYTIEADSLAPSREQFFAVGVWLYHANGCSPPGTPRF